MHVEILVSSLNLATKLIQAMLKRNKFAPIYGDKVHVTVVMDWNQMATKEENICRCHTYPKHVLDSLTRDYRGGIKLLNSKSAVLSLTLFQLILQCSSANGHRLFVLVDCNLYYSEKHFILPNMHGSEAHDHVISIG